MHIYIYIYIHVHIMYILPGRASSGSGSPCVVADETATSGRADPNHSGSCVVGLGCVEDRERLGV